MFSYLRNLISKPPKKDPKKDFEKLLAEWEANKQDVTERLRLVSKDLLSEQQTLDVYTSELEQVKKGIASNDSPYTDSDLANAENKVESKKEGVAFILRLRNELDATLFALDSKITKYKTKFKHASLKNDVAELNSLVYEKMSSTGSQYELEDALEDIERSTNILNAKTELNKEE